MADQLKTYTVVLSPREGKHSRIFVKDTSRPLIRQPDEAKVFQVFTHEGVVALLSGEGSVTISEGKFYD